MQPQVSGSLIKRDPVSLLSTETGILLITGDQSSGRTASLKRIVADSLGQRNCVWLNGPELTESEIKDPVRPLAARHQILNADSESWQAFLEAAPAKNLIVIDDLHRSPLNFATSRRNSIA